MVKNFRVNWYTGASHTKFKLDSRELEINVDHSLDSANSSPVVKNPTGKPTYDMTGVKGK